MSEQRRREHERHVKQLEEKMQDQGNGNGKGQPTEASAPDLFQVIINFKPGTADPDIHVDNRLSPIQLLAAAGVLTWMAGKRLDQTIKLQQQRGIAVPGLVLPKGLPLQ